MLRHRFTASMIGIALLVLAAVAQPALAAHPGPDYVKTVVVGPTQVDVTLTSLWHAIESAELHYAKGVLRITYEAGQRRGEPLTETVSVDLVRDVHQPIVRGLVERLPEMLLVTALLVLFQARRYLARLVRRSLPRLHLKSR